ncbi:MAG: sigma-70 family RNA polymerase sigma factor [Clostridia bacterium]|nr:sigma-70 family RNA polymerase sigma factor [Clostridia bacterium]MBP5657571.1 sigma-70 family RNA polymerase sigma factor [Clostridia bacterium]
MRKTNNSNPYEQTAEYELILAARNNDDSAFETLYKRYIPLVNGCVSSFQVPPSERDDLFQEGMIGLLKAIRTYDNTSSAFQTYASLCVKRSMISALRKYNRANRLVYSAEVPDHIPAPHDAAAGDRYRDEDRQRIMSFVNELSPFEKKTFSLYISGMKYSSMAEKLGCSVKSVDNAITRIKSKIKKFKAR